MQMINISAYLLGLGAAIWLSSNPSVNTVPSVLEVSSLIECLTTVENVKLETFSLAAGYRLYERVLCEFRRHPVCLWPDKNLRLSFPSPKLFSPASLPPLLCEHQRKRIQRSPASSGWQGQLATLNERAYLSDAYDLSTVATAVTVVVLSSKEDNSSSHHYTPQLFVM